MKFEKLDSYFDRFSNMYRQLVQRFLKNEKNYTPFLVDPPACTAPSYYVRVTLYWWPFFLWCVGPTSRKQLRESRKIEWKIQEVFSTLWVRILSSWEEFRPKMIIYFTEKNNT